MYADAQYIKDPMTGVIVSIRVDINGVPSFVPLDTENGDYNEIMRLVDAGELVIAPAS
jgi:hypothetical protein